MKTTRTTLLSSSALKYWFVFVYGLQYLTRNLVVIIYQDLIFDLCLVFIVLFFTKDMFLNNIIWFPLALVFAALVLIAPIWRFRRERI